MLCSKALSDVISMLTLIEVHQNKCSTKEVYQLNKVLFCYNSNGKAQSLTS